MMTTLFICWPVYLAFIMDQLGMFDEDIYNTSRAAKATQEQEEELW